MNDRAHAILSASGSYIWLNCTKSGELSMLPGAAQRQGSIFAAEGTAAHELAETCLREDKDANLYVGLDIQGFKVTHEMAHAVQIYLDHVRGLPPGVYFIEQAITLANLWERKGLQSPTPLFGTSDYLKWTEDMLYVVDYKHGVGVPVEAVGNTQFMYYGLGGVFHILQQGFALPSRVTMTVVQPRAPHKEGGIRSWTIPTIDLFVWAETVLMPAVMSVIAKDTTYKAGQHCRWCPHAGQCPALRKQALEIAKTQFDDVTATPPDANLIPFEELGAILDQAELISAWVTQVRAVVSDAIDKGHKIEGWKLVPKRATRKWADAEAVGVILGANTENAGDFFTDPQVKSPAQVEDILKRSKRKLSDIGLDKFITAESSGTTLAPDADSRPAAPTGPQATFGDVDL